MRWGILRAREGSISVGGRSCIRIGFLISCEYNPLPTEYTYPALPSTSPSADVSYSYDASGQRVLRTTAHQVGASASGVPEMTDAYSVEIFPSLRLDNTSWDGSEYVATAETEGVYLVLGASVLGESSRPFVSVFAGPSTSVLPAAEFQHVFLEMGDRLSSTSVVVDWATSELVERTTYTAYGALDSDYKPERWFFREDYQNLQGKKMMLSLVSFTSAHDTTARSSGAS